jgi:serine/threonine protein kinase
MENRSADGAQTSGAKNDPYGLNAHGYELSGFLGRGATGLVFQGTYIGASARGDLQPGQHVAMKFVEAKHVKTREVLVQAQMQHMNIVRIFDVLACAAAPLLYPPQAAQPPRPQHTKQLGACQRHVQLHLT